MPIYKGFRCVSPEPEGGSEAAEKMCKKSPVPHRFAGVGPRLWKNGSGTARHQRGIHEVSTLAALRKAQARRAKPLRDRRSMSATRRA